LKRKNIIGVCGVGHSALIKKVYDEIIGPTIKQNYTENKMKNKFKFKQGDKVIIHSLGDDNEYEAEVNGITTDWDEEAGLNIYIVKILTQKGLFKDFEYSHFSITGECLRLK